MFDGKDAGKIKNELFEELNEKFVTKEDYEAQIKLLERQLMVLEAKINNVGWDNK